MQFDRDRGLVEAHREQNVFVTEEIQRADIYEGRGQPGEVGGAGVRRRAGNVVAPVERSKVGAPAEHVTRRWPDRDVPGAGGVDLTVVEHGVGEQLEGDGQ